LIVAGTRPIPYFRNHPRLYLTVTVAGVGGVAYGLVILHGVGWLPTSLWFYGVALAATFFRRLVRRRELGTFQWETFAVTCLSVVGFFSVNIYG
jgi:hypothetical protein